MRKEEKQHIEWENDEVHVNIPYSTAGVGTTIVLTSKFTGKLMLLDIGDGTLRDLLFYTKNSEFVNEIDLIALSHGHFDHVGGLHSLLGFMRMLRRKQPLNIVIPKGSKEAIGIIKGFREYYHDTLPFKIWYHEMTQGSGFDTDFFKVKSYEVEHYSLENTSPEEDEILEPALGYRVQVGNSIVAYTGDTRYCTEVEKVVDDADLAIIEATLKEVTKSQRRVHLSREEARQLGQRAKEYVLIHQIPDL